MVEIGDCIIPVFPISFTPDQTVAEVGALITAMSPDYLATASLDFHGITLYVGENALDPTKTMGSYGFNPLDGQLDIVIKPSSPPPMSQKQRFKSETCSHLRNMINKLGCDIPT
jgi:hypothetical protein